MDAFHDLAEMTRDYGLIRYFLMAIAVAAFLMTVLFLWGHVPERAAPDIAAPPPAPAASY